MTWISAWLPTTPASTWRLEVVLAIFLLVSIMASAVFGYLLWAATSHRGGLEKSASDIELETTKTEQRKTSETLAQTREELAVAAKKAAELEARQAPRHLAPEQRVMLIAALRPHTGVEVTVMATIGDAERMVFAMELVEALRAAGWAMRTPAVGQLAAAATGVIVIIHDEATAPPGAAILTSALNKAGIRTVLEVHKDLVSPGRFHLLVGGK
ncbi:MAG: hypothetical protein A2W26_06965 [Acidobacteria bacterium RBG_16_64_8]|nr:MAG: hypothetical protein A2W26_06965 [Acidobacteria bacterium RBG_16_64_8]